MAKKSSGGLSSVLSFLVWVAGVLVSLAVGFGMIGGTLVVPWVQPIVPAAGWIVVILAAVGVILKIVDAAR